MIATKFVDGNMYNGPPTTTRMFCMLDRWNIIGLPTIKGLFAKKARRIVDGVDGGAIVEASLSEL